MGSFLNKEKSFPRIDSDLGQAPYRLHPSARERPVQCGDVRGCEMVVPAQGGIELLPDDMHCLQHRRIRQLVVAERDHVEETSELAVSAEQRMQHVLTRIVLDFRIVDLLLEAMQLR